MFDVYSVVPIVHVLSLFKQTWGISYSLVLLWVILSLVVLQAAVLLEHERQQELAKIPAGGATGHQRTWPGTTTQPPAPHPASQRSAPLGLHTALNHWIYAFTSPIWYHADCLPFVFILLRIYNRQDTTGKHCFVMHWLFWDFGHVYIITCCFRPVERKHSVYIGVRCACRFHS